MSRPKSDPEKNSRENHPVTPAPVFANWELNDQTVALWWQRFCNAGPDWLRAAAAGRGRQPVANADKIKATI